MSTPLTALIVEDSPDDAELILAELRRAGFEPKWKRVEKEPDFLAEINKQPDIILSDYSMPRFNGLHAAQLLRQSGLDIPFILISGTVGEDIAVEAMKQGATDYLLKDRIGRLGSAVRRALEEKRLREEQIQAAQEKRVSEDQYVQLSKIQGAILNALPANIALLDSDGVIISVNDSWQRFGRSNVLNDAASGVGQNYLETCEQARGDWSSEAKMAAVGIRRVLRGELKEFAIEYPCHSPAERRWFRLIATPLSAMPTQAGVVVMHVNVTERKQAEENLRESEARLRTVLDSMFAFVVLLSTDGRVLEVNREPLEGAGLQRKDVLGELFVRTFWWSHSKKAQEQVSDVVHRASLGETVRADFEVRMTEGTIVIDATFGPLRDANGQVTQVVISGVNVTTRIQAEQSRAESELRFRQVVESIQEVYWIVDVALQRIIYISPAYQKIWGRSRDDVLTSANGWVDHVHPDDRERVDQAFKSKMIHGEYDEEYRIVRPDGSVRWIRDRGFPVKDENGLVYRIAGVAGEITGRKEAELKLRRREERFRLLIEHASDVITVINGEGIIRYQSPSSEHVLGFRPEELVGRNVLEFAHPDDAPRVAAAAQRAMSDPSVPVSVEHRSRHHDGQWLTMQSIGRNIPGESSDGFIIVNSRDITERKAADEVLREQAKLLNLAQDGIMVRELDGRILFWNRGAEQIYGWTSEDILGRNAADLLDTDPKRNATAKTLTVNKGEWSGELRQHTRAGTEVIVHAHWTLVRDDDGKPKSILVINRDITEQKQLEGQYLRAQRMESLGTLASGVAHDLNNILSPIMMSVPLLRGSPPQASLERLASIIESSAQRGADIVKQVLTFGRGIAGDRLPLQLTHNVLEMEKIAGQTFPKNIAIRNHLASDLPLIDGDTTQIHQILLNLFVNARDAMASGGILTITTEAFDVDESYAANFADAKAGRYVRITVADTGTGIPRDSLDKIFDPFYTTKEPGKGTGLGLSTVIGIVKSHGGFLNVDSELGKGTTFSVFLPVATSGEQRRASVEDKTVPQGHGERILVVDDEGALRIVTDAILTRSGYEVVLAADGAEAIAIYARQEKDIALVLTDVMMPLMDGVALSRALRRLNPEVKIIASTGQGEEPRKDELKSFGVDAFLTKPYSAPKLLKTIHEVIAAAPRTNPATS
jgi:PAS domain S-box-containing protein